MNLRSLLCLLLVLSGSSFVSADYELGPPERYLASLDLAVIDATVTKITAKGVVHLKTHEVVVGKAGPARLEEISLTCEDGSPAGDAGFKKGRRYLIVTSGNHLFEFTTKWEVVRSFDGELLCHYADQEPSPKNLATVMPKAGLHPLATFKKQIRAVADTARQSPGS